VARQKLGQHFLLRGSVLERIACAVCPDPEPLVIEIGPGRGALTAHLLPRAARLVAIEIDPHLARHLAQKFAGDSRLQLVEADALHADLSQWGPAAVAGNLPYYVATPILEHVLQLGPALRRAVFLLQKEVAERAAAPPGSRAYGYLSVATQLFASVDLLFEVKPAAFHPPPKVDSAVLRLTPRNRAADLGLADPRAFLRFVALCFHQKRKTIRNNLSPVYGKDLLDAWPEASLRAEQIGMEQFAGMYHRLPPP
jgi:16S rRNA (adenine1518-N6/adenine1519-N6)-dimethyltransferase